MGFKEILGQERARLLILNLVSRGRLPHAILFTGGDGICGEEMAIATAKFLLCDSPVEGDSCGLCDSCLRVSKGAHPLLMIVSPENSTIKIDQIRGIISKLKIKVSSGKRRLIVIEKAEALTEEASNALLKVLEEPFPGNIFIITASNYYQLLPTISSRCYHINLKPVGYRELMKYAVENFNISEDEALPYLLLSNGSPKSFARLLAYFDWKNFTDQIEFFGHLPDWKLFWEVQKYLDSSPNLEDFLKFLKAWLVIKWRRAIEEEGKRGFFIERYTDLFEVVEEAEQRLKFNVNKALLLEEVIMELREKVYEKDCGGSI